MKSLKTVLSLLAIFFLISSLYNKAHADRLNLYWQSDDQRNITWEVGFRWFANYVNSSRYGYRSGLLFDTTNFNSGCSGGFNRCGYETVFNIDNRGGPTYAVQWSTACVDPIVRASAQGNNEAGDPVYDVYANIGVVDAVSANIVGGRSKADVLDGLQWYSGNGGGTIDFYDACPNRPNPRYEIDGRVYVDENGNGERDSGEPVRNNVRVRKSGDETESMLTEDGGRYRFFNLPAGDNYRIWMDMPNGYRCSPRDDCDVRNIRLGPNKNYDLGIIPDDGPIGGQVLLPNGSPYRDGAQVVRKANNANNYSENNNDLTDDNGNYRFTNLNGGSIHDIRLARTGDDFSFGNQNKIDACVYTPQSNDATPWVKENIGVGNTDVNFRLELRTYRIAGRLLWDPDGSGGGNDVEPYVNQGNIPGKDVRVRVSYAGNPEGNDLVEGSLGRNDSQAGRFSIGGLRTDENGRTYTVTIDRSGPDGIRETHRVVGGNTREVNINCGDQTDVVFYIAPNGNDIRGNITVDTNRDGIGDVPYVPPANRQARIEVVGSSRFDTTDTSQYQIAGMPNGTYSVRLMGGNNLREGYTIVSTNPVTNVRVNGDDVGGINFVVRPPANATYSISGGLFLDTNPVTQRNDEPYVRPVGGERITITNVSTNTERQVATADFAASNAYYVDGLSAGTYDVAFSNPRNRYGVSFHPSAYRVSVGTNPSCPGCRVVNTDVAGVDFGISQGVISQAWYQTVGGDFRIDRDNLTNVVPAGDANTCGGTTRPFVAADTTNMNAGIVFTGENPTFTGGNNQSSKANPQGWLVEGSNFGSNRSQVVKTSYSYIAASIRKGRVTLNDMISNQGNRACNESAGNNCTLRDNLTNGAYRYSGSPLRIGGNGAVGNYSFAPNRDYVFLINSDLIINSNITVPRGSSVIFVVNGDITVNPGVTILQGIYSADDSLLTPGAASGADSTLNVEGNMIANAALIGGTFNNTRTLGQQNDQCPAVRITARPDFVINGPEILRYSHTLIQEVAPGPVDVGVQGGGPEAPSAPPAGQTGRLSTPSVNPSTTTMDRDEDITISASVNCSQAQCRGTELRLSLSGGLATTDARNQNCGDMNPGATCTKSWRLTANNCSNSSVNVTARSTTADTKTGNPVTININGCDREEDDEDDDGGGNQGGGGDRDFPFYCQYGKVNDRGVLTKYASWNYQYSGGKYCNIVGSGCAMASLAMIMTYFGDNVTPDEASRKATNNKYSTNLGCQSPGTLTSQLEDTVAPWLRNRGYLVPGGRYPNMVNFTYSGGNYRGRINPRAAKQYLDSGYLLLGGAKITYASGTGLSGPAGHAFVITDINVQEETMTVYDPTFCRTGNTGGRRVVRDITGLDGALGCSSGNCGWVQLIAIKKRK